ncbi:hypothetical protein GCM10010298_33510 [Streptomyces microflavus]|nr:hypothetical protein GCM10010298_33510 [Streptomyces microflavus]
MPRRVVGRNAAPLARTRPTRIMRAGWGTFRVGRVCGAARIYTSAASGARRDSRTPGSGGYGSSPAVCCACA